MQWIKKALQYIATWSVVSRLVFFFSLFALLTWSIAIGTAWRLDARHISLFYDTHMQFLARSLGDLDLEKMPGEVDEIEEILPKKRKKKFADVNDTFSFAVFAKDGTRILSDDDDGKDFPFLTGRGYKNYRTDDKDWDLDGDRWRFYIYPVLEGEFFVLVGQDLEHRHEIVFKVMFRHAWPWFILLPIFILGITWILYKEFKPLRALTQSLQSRAADDTKPLDVARLTPETRPLVLALNALFERITSLMQKERAFVSNAAHELRTPLAGLRVQAEVMEMCMDDAEARENSLQKILEGTTRCTHLVEQLLLLSSLEAKPSLHEDSAAVGEIPWDILVQDAMDTVASAAALKALDVLYVIEEEPRLQKGYAELWGIALRNLLDNAVRYTPAMSQNGVVRIRLVRHAVIVENSAPHVSPEALAQLGSRFYRPPGQKEKGSGLGLAIVQHIATLHGARMVVENVALEGAEQGYGVRISILL